MTHLLRIKDTLNAAACLGSAGTPSSPLEAVADTINRTIMPQDLRFELSDGSTLRLIVRDRRLHRMELGLGNSAPWDTNLESKNCRAVANALAERLHGMTLNGMSANVIDASEDISGLGIAALGLRSELFTETETAETLDLEARITRFSARMDLEVEASFAMASDEVAILSGSEQTADALLPAVLEVLAMVTDEDFVLAGALETDGMLALPHPTNGEGCLFVVGELGILGVLAIGDAGPAAMLAAWRTNWA